MAVKHLIKSLDATKIGYLLTDSLPPVVTGHRGVIRLPFELYNHGDLVILLSESLPPTREMQKFVKGVTEWVANSGMRDAVLIGGLDHAYSAGNIDDEARFIYTTSFNPEGFEGMKPLEDGLFVVGPLALFMTLFQARGFPAAAILPYALRDRADPRAAAHAIKFVNSYYGLNVEVQELIADAETLEMEINKRASIDERGYDESLGYIK
ncbi:MAG: PAC2 family protein [Candidatus Marsarchaeota archaeon]|nr:PAC2 family protein [Candidatus Marsarchaeota archaeon]